MVLKGRSPFRLPLLFPSKERGEGGILKELLSFRPPHLLPFSGKQELGLPERLSPFGDTSLLNPAFSGLSQPTLHFFSHLA